jgi:arylsulfatase A-like enzyme
MKHVKKYTFLAPLFLIAVFVGTFVRDLRLVSGRGSEKNLIIISIDTIRQDSLGVYGYSKNTTPNIDEFAKQATVFTNAYTQVPLTYASFVSLMTGKSPFESGIHSNVTSQTLSDGFDPGEELVNGHMRLKDDTMTLARILQDNNYATGAFTTIYTLEPELTHLNIGFDTYESDVQKNVKIRLNPQATIDRAFSWVGEQDRSKPLFLWVHFMDPHAPYLPYPSSACKINSEFCNKDAEEMIRGIEKERLSKKVNACLKFPLDQHLVDHSKELYDAEIIQTDQYVGQVLEKLRERGLDKNSVIVLYGDHGESFEHNFYFLHGLTLYDSTTKIPLIIYTPDNAGKGKFVSNFVRSIDIFPSILSLLGIESKLADTEKKDFSALLKNPSEKIKSSEPLYFVNGTATKFAVRKGDFKYILSLDGDKCKPEGSMDELYNLKNDPKELKNLVSVDKATAYELRTMLTEYLEKNPLEAIDNNKKKKPVRNTTPSDKKREMIENLKSLGY